MSDIRWVSDAPTHVMDWASVRVGAPPQVDDLRAASLPMVASSTRLHLPIWSLSEEVTELALAAGIGRAERVDLGVFHSATVSGPLDRLLGRLRVAGLYPRRVAEARREPGSPGSVLLIQLRRRDDGPLRQLGAAVRLAGLSQVLRDPGVPSPRVASDDDLHLDTYAARAGWFAIRPEWAEDEVLLRHASPQVIVAREPASPAVTAAASQGARVARADDRVGIATALEEVVGPLEFVVTFHTTTDDVAVARRFLQVMAGGRRARIAVPADILAEVAGLVGDGDNVEVVDVESRSPWRRPTPDQVVSLLDHDWEVSIAGLQAVAARARSAGVDVLESRGPDGHVRARAFRANCLDPSLLAALERGLDLGPILRARGATLSLDPRVPRAQEGRTM